MSKYYHLCVGPSGGLECQYIGRFESFNGAADVTDSSVWILDEAAVHDLQASITLSLSLNNLTIDTKR